MPKKITLELEAHFTIYVIDSPTHAADAVNVGLCVACVTAPLSSAKVLPGAV